MTFSEDVIGSLKFYARSIHGIDDDVRLTNRLFLPGENFVVLILIKLDQRMEQIILEEII